MHGIVAVIPALLILIVYYSIASCNDDLSLLLTLSNSSIQQIPPLANGNAPGIIIGYYPY